ncbi:MAG: hypothetical protein B6D44_13595 [Ignavibacteriales bacterium UTCHB2]|jgi:hypothetical protein|nr:MAG: hypothetical protein B6D44_13595 [Ignavibacteriales bacterium UTCHB2]
MANKEDKKKNISKKTSSKKTKQKFNQDQEELGLISKQGTLVKEPQSFINTESFQVEEQKKIRPDYSQDNSDYQGMYPRYLSSSVNLLSFLSDSLGLQDIKIIPAIEIALLSASLDKVSKIQLTSISIERNYSLVFLNNHKEIRSFGIIFFCLFSNERYFYSKDEYFINFYNLCYKLLSNIDSIKEGENSLNIVLGILKDSIEISSFPKLQQFLKEYKPDQFSQLNDIAEKIITFLNETKIDDKHLNNWKTAIWAFLWVLRYSTQSSEILIDDLLNKKGSQFKELHIVLIGLFATKLFHSSPSWKPIGLSYQLYEKMKVLQPAAEVFYNPNIITSLSSDPKKQEEYFWTYVWGKPYSIFENATKKEVKKYQKKLIEVEEEIIVEENTFGNFITISGEPKPTGIIHIKTKI